MIVDHSALLQYEEVRKAETVASFLGAPLLACLEAGSLQSPCCISQ